MPGTNNETARKEEVKKIVENRRRKAELIREQQIKKRNTIIAIGVGILVVLILVMVLAKSCSSGKKTAKTSATTAKQITTVAQTTVQETTTAEEYMYTTDVLNLRKSASAKSKLITQIGAGKKVQVISENGKWCQIKYGKDTGYVMKKYLSYSNMLA